MKKTPTAVAGDTWVRAWVLRTAAGVPLDLTGATARLQVRDESGALVLAANPDNGWLILTPAAGRIDLVAPLAVPAGRYRFGLEVTFADGRVRTVEQSPLVVVEDIVHD